jgi:hypothetical protein
MPRAACLAAPAAAAWPELVGRPAEEAAAAIRRDGARSGRRLTVELVADGAMVEDWCEERVQVYHDDDQGLTQVARAPAVG